MPATTTYKSRPPLLKVGFHQGSDLSGRAGIVDENVKLAGFLEKIGDLFAVGDVGLHAEHAAIGILSFDGGFGPVEVLGVSTSQHHLSGPGTGKVDGGMLQHQMAVSFQH